MLKRLRNNGIEVDNNQILKKLSESRDLIISSSKVVKITFAKRVKIEKKML